MDSESGPGPSADRPLSLATGQVFEFRLWAELIEQSAGQLHVFLPLLDRGLDAVLHRLSDGAYIGVQAKCRTSARWHEVHVVVPEEELASDDTVLVAGRLHDGELGPYLLVVPAGEFKRLAYRWPGLNGRYEAWFREEAPAAESRWAPYVVERSSLGSRLMGMSVGAGPAVVAPVSPAVGPAVAVATRAAHDRWLGFMGEAEVIRQLALAPDLDLFRPFPDLELVEVLARHHLTERFAGLQVKAPALDGKHRQAHAGVAASTLRPEATSLVVVLVWLPEAGRFSEECLLIPAARLPELAMLDGRFYLIEFRPSGAGGRASRYDPFRVALRDLGATVSKLVGGPLP